LLHSLGQQPSRLAAFRAYYVSQLGKYLPGKAVAVVMRVALVRSPGVSGGVAALTTFYEVLTTMASGVLLAAVLSGLFMEQGSLASDWEGLRNLIIHREWEEFHLDRRLLVLFSLGMLLPVGLPLLPGIFNRIAYRVSKPFRVAEAPELPRVR